MQYDGNFDYSVEPTGDYAFIDMKSFYASCELVARGLNPLTELLVVMSNAENAGGLILASSPMAKKLLGITNVTRKYDLPTARENPHMKDLLIVPPRMRYYIKQNLIIQNIIRHYAQDEDILWYSIDEGVVDLTKSLKLFAPTLTNRAQQLDSVSRMMQRDILRTTGIYSTVGMSNSNPLLAKLALDNEAKHDVNMRALWNYDNVAEKVWQIPKLTDFWGIGSRMEKNFQHMGITTIYELAHANPERLAKKFGVLGLQYYHHANGIDRTKIQKKYTPKSKNLGNSQILPHDYQASEMPVLLQEMAEQVAIRLRRRNAKTTTVHLMIGYARDEFERGFSRQVKIDATDNTKVLAAHLTYLFNKFYNGQLVRSIGVTYSNLVYDAGLQLNLLDDIEKQLQDERLDHVMDKIREKYGFVAIVKASSLLAAGRSIKRAGLVGGHDGGAGGLDGL